MNVDFLVDKYSTKDLRGLLEDMDVQWKGSWLKPKLAQVLIDNEYNEFIPNADVSNNSDDEDDDDDDDDDDDEPMDDVSNADDTMAEIQRGLNIQLIEQELFHFDVSSSSLISKHGYQKYRREILKNPNKCQELLGNAFGEYLNDYTNFVIDTDETTTTYTATSKAVKDAPLSTLPDNDDKRGGWFRGRMNGHHSGIEWTVKQMNGAGLLIINDTDKISDGQYRKQSISYYGYAKKATSKHETVNDAIGELMDESIEIQKRDKSGGNKKIQICNDVTSEKEELDRNKANMTDEEYERQRRILADKALLMITGGNGDEEEKKEDVDEDEDDDDDDDEEPGNGGLFLMGNGSNSMMEECD